MPFNTVPHLRRKHVYGILSSAACSYKLQDTILDDEYYMDSEKNVSRKGTGDQAYVVSQFFHTDIGDILLDRIARPAWLSHSPSVAAMASGPLDRDVQGMDHVLMARFSSCPTKQ